MPEKTFYTVVVADDETELREAVCTMIPWEALGFHLVGSASNGLDALQLVEQLEARGAIVTDATCPKVKHIHGIVSRADEEGRFVIIIGMRRHPEVEAICGWCSRHQVFENAAELEEWLEEHPDFWDKPLSVVVQTTQTGSNFTECCNIIKKRCTNAKISDTICFATSTRQEEAAAIASRCDAMVVIGGKHSANSIHLAQICAENCP